MVTATVIVAVRAQAIAHGVVGDRGFLSPIVGNDAFPDNALDLTVRRSDYGFSLVPELEKQLSEDSSVLVTGGWTRLEPGAARDKTSGPTDVWMSFRQSAYKSSREEMEFTLSPFVVLPTGDRRVPDQGYTHLGGEALLGKGLGDLRDSRGAEYLSPLALQAEFGYAARVQGKANSDVFGNFELEYSLDYLERFVAHRDPLGPASGFMPYVQFNYSQALIASRLTTKPDFRFTPGVAYLSEYCEISAGAQIALNGAAQSRDRIAAIGLVEIFYDNIFPPLGWNPLSR